MRENYESLTLIGGSHDGRTISVVAGTKLIRLPKKEPDELHLFAAGIPNPPPPIEVYARRKIEVEPGRIVHFLVLETLNGPEALHCLLRGTD